MGKTRKPQLPKPLPAADRDPEEDAAARAERVRQLVGEGARKLEEALSLDPHNVSAAINLGGAYILQGKHQRAVPALEAASRLEPDNAMVWSNLAAAYLGKLPLSTPEQQERAIAAYERALAIDPRAPNVHYNLGLIYLERNDAERAAACFRDARKTDPNDRDAQYWLDRIREKQEAPTEADDEDDGATC
jgi:tetratricopeptide (TPR) repeat protein